MACCSNFQYVLLLLQSLLWPALLAAPAAHGLFREYIGGEFKSVRFSDVPVHAGVDFHFILSFAIDYTTAISATPTDGQFNVFLDAANLAPSDVLAVKRRHGNAKVRLSVGGDFAYLQPSSVESWVSNAVFSLTNFIERYHLDGIDIDYEHFKSDPDTFAECIGQLLVRLKRSGVVSFASIAPYNNATVQSHYLALWNKYGHVIDYVNFQFYAYDRSTTVPQFLEYFEKQRSNYHGGRVLASFATDGTSGGLSPANGFFRGCRILKEQGKLGGIFVWSADDSKSNGFRYEKQAQSLLASAG